MDNLLVHTLFSLKSLWLPENTCFQNEFVIAYVSINELARALKKSSINCTPSQKVAQRVKTLRYLFSME